MFKYLINLKYYGIVKAISEQFRTASLAMAGIFAYFIIKQI